MPAVASYAILRAKNSGMKYPSFEEEHEEDNGRHCLECGKELVGRYDRKFCSSQCKNHFHNERTVKIRRYHERLSRCLSTNYGILDKLYKMNISYFAIEDLIGMGFRPELCTSCRVIKGGITEHSCFEYKYRISEARMFNLRKTDVNL